jgi:hypothetical protein
MAVLALAFEICMGGESFQARSLPAFRRQRARIESQPSLAPQNQRQAGKQYRQEDKAG